LTTLAPASGAAVARSVTCPLSVAVAGLGAEGVEGDGEVGEASSDPLHATPAASSTAHPVRFNVSM